MRCVTYACALRPRWSFSSSWLADGDADRTAEVADAGSGARAAALPASGESFSERSDGRSLT